MKDKIIKFLTENGAGEVGFAKAKENEFGLPYSISFDIPLSLAVVEGITDKPTHTYFHHYRTVNTLIDNLSLRLGLMLQEEGYRFACVPASQSVNGLSGVYSHKYGAVKAGLGVIGKSGLFVSEKFGPSVRLGTILTDCEFDTEEVKPVSGCGDCDLCVKACPAMAITGQHWAPDEEREKIIDAKACSDYMKKAFQHIGRGAVCGVCMRVCPKNKR